MAIAFDAASETFSNSTSSLGWSHTCTGSDRILWVYVMHNSGAGTISSVTYNGVALTKYVEDALGQRSSLWYLIAPSTGTNTITVTPSTTMYCYTAAASYTGVHQTSFLDGSDTSSAAQASLASSITTTQDNCWTILGARQQSTGNTDASTGCTERAAGAVGTVQLYDSNSAITPAGVYSMTTTQSATGTTGHVMAAFAPSTGGGGSTFKGLLMMGVG
jgi:hypothetical protein